MPATARRRPHRLATLSAALLLAAPALAPPAFTPDSVEARFAPAALLAQGITAEQVAELRQVSAVAISPDGEWVAYTLSQPRALDDPPGRPFAEVYVVPAAGGEPRAVIEGPNSASGPAWSPDGERLGFVARLEERHDRPQVYAVPAEGGEPERLTDAPDGVAGFAWSPDGEAIAFTAREPESEEARERREAGWDMQVAGEDERHLRLWLQPAGGGDARALTPPDLTVRDFVWAPDGGRLAVQMTEETGADADLMFRRLYLVPVEGGGREAGEPELLAPTEGKLGPMAWSPDGENLAYLGATSFHDPLAQSVFVVPAAGGEPRNLIPAYEGSAEWVGWTDAGAVLFAAVEGTRTALRRVPVAGGEAQRILGGGPEILRSLDLADDRDRFAAPVSTPAHPNEVYVGSFRARTAQRLTDHNPWLEGVALADQETIVWEGADGWRIEGVLTRPLGLPDGERAPLAVLPHGGPEGVSVDGWTTRALYPAQLLAANGYAVLEPNYRGSGGRGVAFSMGDHRDLGGKEFEDVLAGIDHLAEMGLVDPERVGISGTSYGGYFSAWAGTRHSDRFAAAITFAGLSNWISFTGTTDIPVEMSEVHWNLWWFDNPGQTWDRSPVAWLVGADTPILVAHGLADDRVHPEQSLQLHQFLELKGVPTGLVLYPREPHGLLERPHQIDFMRRMLEWFDRHVKGTRDDE